MLLSEQDVTVVVKYLIFKQWLTIVSFKEIVSYFDHFIVVVDMSANEVVEV